MTYEELKAKRNTPEQKAERERRRKESQLVLYAEGHDIGVSKDAPEDVTCFSGVYTHSECLRNKVDDWGFDLIQATPYIINSLKDYDGAIFDVTLAFPNGEKNYDCRLFFWTTPYYNEFTDFYGNYTKRLAGNRTHGLIVSKSDEEMLKDAKQKFDERREFI